MPGAALVENQFKEIHLGYFAVRLFAGGEHQRQPGGWTKRLHFKDLAPMERCGICQGQIPQDLYLSIAQTTAAPGAPDETVEEHFRLLLCRTCWSTIGDEHSASGKYFRGLIMRPARLAI